MTGNKNKYHNKYMALKQNKRRGQIRKACQRRTNPCKDPQGTLKDISKTELPKTTW